MKHFGLLINQRVLSVIIALIANLAVTAGNVTTEQATQIAQQFLNERQTASAAHAMRMAKRQPLALNVATEATAYYVFNVGTDNGFVMVSGSDLAPKVLAYADKGSFKPEAVPANMQAWLDGYADQIAYLERTGGKNEVPRLLLQRNAVAPLLTSTWYQDAPYNNKCPLDPTTSNRCVTGCVATALAQVLYYYKYPNKTIATIPSYTTETKKINMPAIGITNIAWDKMLDNYNSSATTTQNNAVAQLMLLCGQATEMDYGYPESGADMSLDVKALQNYFGYDKTVRVLARNAFGTSEWESLIYDELSERRPVLYGGASSGGGHAFVVDGYSRDGLFHINWGWNGDGDGYFQLSVLNPYINSAIGASDSYDGFSYWQDAVVGIQHGSGEIVPELFTVTSITGEGTYTRSSSTDDFTGIKITSAIINRTSDTHSFLLGLALYDSEDEWVDILKFGEYNAVDFGEVSYWEDDSFDFTDIRLGANLPNGDYFIVPVSASENSEVWEPCWGANVYRIKATISGNKLKLSDPVQKLSCEKITVSGNPIECQTLQLSALITNKGTYYNNDIFIVDKDWEYKGGCIFELKEGESSLFNIDYIPAASGEQTLYLAYIDGDYIVRFASVDLSIAEDKTKLDYKVSVTNAAGDLLTENKANVKVSVTNKNTEYYDNEVLLGLYKYDENDDCYYGVDIKTKHLTLANGTTTSFDFVFENLENEQQYLLSFEYIKARRRISDYKKYVEFTTLFESELDNVIYTENARVLAGDDLVLPIKMRNSALIRGFQFNMYLPSGVTAAKTAKGKIKASLSPGRLEEDDAHTLSVTEQDDGSLLFLCGSQDEDIFTGNDGEVATVTLEVAENMNKGDYPITLKKIKLTESDINKFYEVSMFKSTLTVIPFTLGDINGDGQVDVSDYIGVANRIHGNAPDGFIERAGDVDGNGDYDVSDYIGVANIIHSGSIYGADPRVSITTKEASDIGEYDAKLNGYASVSNVKQSYSMGFFISTSGTPSAENNTKNVVYSSSKTGEFSGEFSAKATGLTYSTTYYYCSYILYKGTYYYGETKSFTTIKNASVITATTNEATSVGETSAKLNGSVSVTYAKTSYSMGFFVSTSGTPGNGNYIKKVVYSSSKTGDYTGSISSTVSDLSYSTTYYYRSYVFYDGTYYYGETKSFTTTRKTTFAVGEMYPYSNPVGVVFYVSNGGKSGKIASLQTSRGNWYTAKSWASNYGDGWYLPSKSELQQIASNYSELNNRIDSGCYWASTVYSSGVIKTDVWLVVIKSWNGFSNGYSFYNTVTDDNNYDIIAVKSF